MTELSPQLMRLWARWCAREVVHLWDAPEVVCEWLDTGDEDLRTHAAAAAHAGHAANASVYAARATISSAASYAANAADVAAYAIDATAISAIGSWSDLYDIERNEQHETKTLIKELSASLTGLSSLRLDIAHNDPWLTREVWRTLELEDMQLVEDWYEWIETKTRNGGQKDQNERQDKMEAVSSVEGTAGKGRFVHPNS